MRVFINRYLSCLSFFQDNFLTNQEQTSLKFTSDADIMRLSKQVSKSSKYQISEGGGVQTDWLYKSGVL